MSKGDMATMIREAVDHVLHGADGPHILFGPVCRAPEGDTRAAPYYFVVISGSRGSARNDCLGSPERDLAEQLRRGMIAALIGHRPPLVLQDFDDELRLAQMSHAIWPSARTRRIIAGIKAEREVAG